MCFLFQLACWQKYSSLCSRTTVECPARRESFLLLVVMDGKPFSPSEPGLPPRVQFSVARNKSNRLKFPSDLRLTHLNGNLRSDFSDLSILLKKPRKENHTRGVQTIGNATVANFLLVGGILDSRPCCLNSPPF